MQSKTDIIETKDKFDVKNWMDPNPPFVRLGTSLEQVAQLFQKKDVGCIPVVTRRMEPIGIVTEKLVLHHFLNGGEKQKPLLDGVFKSNFQTLYFEDSIFKMNISELAVYPVVDKQNRLVGMLTRKEIVNSLLLYKKEMR